MVGHQGTWGELYFQSPFMLCNALLILFPKYLLEWMSMIGTCIATLGHRSSQRLILTPIYGYLCSIVSIGAYAELFGSFEASLDVRSFDLAIVFEHAVQQ